MERNTCVIFFCWTKSNNIRQNKQNKNKTTNDSLSGQVAGMASTTLLGRMRLGAYLVATGGRSDDNIRLQMGRTGRLDRLRRFVRDPASCDVVRNRPLCGVVVALVPRVNGGNHRGGVSLVASGCHPVATSFVRGSRHDAARRRRRCGSMDVAAPGGLARLD